jgi:hypothetical protein
MAFGSEAMNGRRRRKLAAQVLAPLVLALVLVACSNNGNEGASSPPSSLPSPSPTQTAPPPSPTPSPPAGFQCGSSFKGGSASSGAPTGPTVTGVRVGGHTGFDRFVMEFSGPVPSYKVVPQNSPVFTLDPKGTKVTLQGTTGVLITVKPENWQAYSGPTGMRPGLPFLKQARMVQNFEGTMQRGLGIQGVPCLMVTTLNSPPRLVVDVAGV